MPNATDRNRTRPPDDAILAMMDAMTEALLLVSPRQHLLHGNAAARRILNLADDATSLADARGIVTGGNGGHVLQLDDGRAYNLTPHPLATGATLIRLTAVTEPPAPAGDYHTVFENAVYGIYRDTLDGKPLRANRALAQLNGYETEDQYLAGVAAHPGNWYVDERRGQEFHHLLKRNGRVRDFVSEVYRHRTRETLWITENAWYVFDAQGRPMCIEGTIQDATERVQHQATIERQANTDALTGTASRFRFLRELNAATRTSSAECVLLTIDLDKFKDVNDLMGHAAGDAVLKEVAKRLTPIGGKQALLARLGGDEFAMLLTGRHCHMQADTVAAEIVKSLRSPVDVEGQPASLGASVGVAVYPAHAGSAEELLSHADLALYEMKASGRNGFRIFDPQMKTRIDRRKAMENELREAIRAGELELYYQPIVEASSKDIAGFEALMRWNHPRRGFLPPAEFIQLAEDAGLMTELGDWAIRRACDQAVKLPDHLFVAVNVSPSQFRSSGIVSVVRRTLGDTGLKPSRLTLEVTETAILSREASAARVIDDLLKLGIGLALDDFGTGYSSLSYLQRFAFSKVKIDRSFVAGMEQNGTNLAIIRAVVGLAADLGIEVVAEGIETAGQANLLRQNGCNLLQGYLYGRPRSFAETQADVLSQSLRKTLPQGNTAAPAPTVDKWTIHKPLYRT